MHFFKFEISIDLGISPIDDLLLVICIFAVVELGRYLPQCPR